MAQNDQQLAVAVLNRTLEKVGIKGTTWQPTPNTGVFAEPGSYHYRVNLGADRTQAAVTYATVLGERVSSVLNIPASTAPVILVDHDRGSVIISSGKAEHSRVIHSLRTEPFGLKAATSEPTRGNRAPSVPRSNLVIG